jgi:hypothetical protein
VSQVRRSSDVGSADRMVNLLLTILVAIVAYWLLVPLAGLPVIVGAIAAILVLIVGFGGADAPGGGARWRTWRW